MGHHDTEDQTASLTLTNCADKNLKLAEQATWSWRKKWRKKLKIVMIPDTSDKTASLTLTYCAATWSVPCGHGEKQKIENGTHWYARIKLNGKLIILGNVAQWQERKISRRSRTCSRREGKDYRKLWQSGPDTQFHTLAYLFLDKKWFGEF